MKTCIALFSLSSLFLAALAAVAQPPNTAPASKPTTIPMTKVKPMPEAASSPSVEPLKAGATAPDFTAKNVAGKTLQLADWKDKTIVLDFWATWCGPCMASLPHTQEVARRYKDQDVVVFAVCTSDTRANFEKWVKANQAKYPDITFACDANERGSATEEQRASKKLYGVRGIPTQFVIDRTGKIAAALVGYDANDARLEAGLARAGLKVDPDVSAKGESQLKKN